MQEKLEKYAPNHLNQIFWVSSSFFYTINQILCFTTLYMMYLVSTTLSDPSYIVGKYLKPAAKFDLSRKMY